VEQGFGVSQYKALVRNFSQNKDIIFVSEVNNFIKGGHPTLLARLAFIDKLLKKEKKYEGNDPETESDKTNKNFDNAKSNDRDHKQDTNEA